MKGASFCIAVVIGLSCARSVAQNLIPNGSFESFNASFKYNQHALTGIKMIEHWKVPNRGTPDLYHKNSQDPEFTYDNKFGTQLPKTGDAYLGLRTTFDREYLQVKLVQPLLPQHRYLFSMWISLADDSEIVSSCLGVHFSHQRIKTSKSYGTMVLESDIANPVDSFIEEKEKWVLFHGTYEAKGGEEYVTIGCFDEQIITKLIATKKRTLYVPAYLYVDEVSLNLMTEDPNELSELEVPSDTSQNDTESLFSERLISDSLLPITYTSDEIGFETGKAELSQTKLSQLDTLAYFLDENASLAIKVFGFTDNIGKEEDNLTLSRGRAKAVVEYLISKGIAKERLEYEGIGSREPIATNDTEEGRALNRRVEIIFVQE